MTVIAIAENSFLLQLKNQVFKTAIVCGIFLVYGALLAGAMSGEQKARAIFDFGAGFIEVSALVMAVFASANAIVKDIETKGIYLILSRPVGRLSYIAGRFLGIAVSVWIFIILAGAALAVMLAFNKADMYPQLLAALGSIGLKTAVACALAVLVSLVTTSVISTISISVIFLTLGNFTAEIKYIAEKSSSFAGLTAKLLYYVIPDMSFLSCHNSCSFSALFYALAYSVCALSLAAFMFRRKEF